jgi:proline dehydrogenase
MKALEALTDVASYLAVATHDEWLLQQTLANGALCDGAHEFQMLLGVREERASELVRSGRPLRVYVPFGEQWYEYSLRRLQENPEMAGTIARATVGRVLGRG